MNPANHNSNLDSPNESTDAESSDSKGSRISNFFRRKNKIEGQTNVNMSMPEIDSTVATQTLLDPAPEIPENASLENGLEPTRLSLLYKIGKVFKGSFDLNDTLFEELEETLISCDIGVEASLNLVDRLRDRVKTEKIPDAESVLAALRREISEVLRISQSEWPIIQKPYVILVVGVNGVGKTTTTAKIANHFKQQGKSVMLAAADTFRAAAVEQLQVWGNRLDIPVISQGLGADAAAVAHDALTSALAHDIDVLLIDTAGRLHTQTDLMQQLQKVSRVLHKIDPHCPHEVMQILDASTGQNALAQLQHFHNAVGVSSLCLTKLDGSAKGGVILSLIDKTKLPIRFIGVGENFDDLKTFNASEYAEGLIPASASL